MMNKFLIGILAVLFLGGAVYWIMDDTRDSDIDTEQIEIKQSGPEQKARQDLATKLGISVNEITIVEAEPTEWSDGCLGLGGPAESCLAAIVPGLRVELSVEGKTYVYRTDLTGASIRLETQ